MRHEMVIYYDNKNMAQIKNQDKMIPAILVPEWPKQARDWKGKNRRYVTDPRTRLTYVWPINDEIVKYSFRSGN